MKEGNRMNDNPIISIVSTMQTQGKRFNPPSLSIGKVLEVEPLKVKTGDLILEREDLLISDFLLNGYSRELTLSVNGESTLNGVLNATTSSVSGGSGEDSFASHSHTINSQSSLTGEVNLTLDGVATFKNCLNVNDLLALMETEDRQLYVVLFKVV